MILDMTCGSRSMWFDKNTPGVVYMDKRKGCWETTTKRGLRKTVTSPMLMADFTALPFCDEVFDLVVFDPPHLSRAGNEFRFAHMYGRLFDDWEVVLSRGFSEGFRVLKRLGFLIFKWSDGFASLSQVLELAPYQPLFGQRSRGKGTHWVTFRKLKGAIDARGKARPEPEIDSIGGL